MNELTQKNAELGRFLFCERYTLQPVKNSLFIAEGQDLKRGAVVDVNGVLVGTNSLMPYAVLENDCDTRAKGAFASVFVKGEFNFDKLSFADGLSKEDLDNIVYNGSGIGLVIKPYDYEKSFSSAMVPVGTSEENPIMNAVEIEELIFANKEIGEATIRFSFSNPDYSPLTSPNPFDRGYHEGTWTKLETKYANIWEYHTNEDVTSWSYEFSKHDSVTVGNEKAGGFCYSNPEWNKTKILKIDFTGIEDISFLFANCLDIVELPAELDTSNITKASNAFRTLYRVKKFPTKLDFSSIEETTGSYHGLQSTFSYCYSMKKHPELILPTHNIECQLLFVNCISLEHLKLDLSYVSNVSLLASGCKSLLDADVKTSEVTENMSYMLSRTINLKNIDSLITTDVTNVSNMLNVSGGQGSFELSLYDGSKRNLVLLWDKTDNGNSFSEVPSLTFPAATNCTGLYRGREGIDTIPDLSVYTPAITNAKNLFYYCTNVKYGMVEAYNFLVSRGSALTDHTDTFFNCGINTAEGRAARALIPKSWGGDAEG